MIEAHGLAIRAGGRILAREIDFAAGAGECIAVVGPNGAGKTTLLRTLAGLLAPASGSISVDGEDIGHLGTARAQHVAFIASDESVFETLRVHEVVATGRYPYHAWWDWREHERDRDAVMAALRSVGMTDFHDRLFATLSSGEQQRVWLAMALAQQTSTLLLDEPTSHLDVRVASEILALLHTMRDEGKSVICVMHDLNQALAFAGRLLVLGEDGYLGVYSPERALQARVLDQAFGIELQSATGLAGRTFIFPR